MNKKAFDRVNERCELLSQEELWERLQFPKEFFEDSKEVLIYYTFEGQEFYPSFQIGNLLTINKIIDDLKVNRKEKSEMNTFVQHLVDKMDFKNYAEEENIQYRFALLKDEYAIEIIKRDWINRYEMGQ